MPKIGCFLREILFVLYIVHIFHITMLNFCGFLALFIIQITLIINIHPELGINEGKHTGQLLVVLFVQQKALFILNYHRIR